MARTTSRPPSSAARNYALSALITSRAVREAGKVRPRGVAAVARVVATHQMLQAQTAQMAVQEMLTEQEIQSTADAMLNLAGFTTGQDQLGAMLSSVDMQAEFDRLVASIVTDVARAAESVSVAVRPHISHVRFVNLPCCSRCAILAGRVYRWSEGFMRHPGCDCTMIPTTVASPLVQDPEELVRRGEVTGLSKADMRALDSGGNLNRIVNVRQKRAGLLVSGQALYRRGKLTPAGVYHLAGDDREMALKLLKANGYLL